MLDSVVAKKGSCGFFHCSFDNQKKLKFILTKLKYIFIFLV